MNARVTRPGLFAVWAPDRTAEIPTTNVAVATYAVTEPDGGRLWIAQYGNVDVLEVSDSYLSANFEVTFTHGELTGFFTALGCTDWARNASVPAPPLPPDR